MPRAVAPEDLQFILRAGVIQVDVQQEAVELSLGQRIGAGLLQRVLRRHDHEQFRQRPGFATDGDLALLHGFQQGRLDLGRGAVDLVGEDDFVEQRPLDEMEARLARIVDVGAGEVARQQVGGELHTAKAGMNTGRQGLHRGGLGQAGQTLDQDVAPVSRPISRRSSSFSWPTMAPSRAWRRSRMRGRLVMAIADGN